MNVCFFFLYTAITFDKPVIEFDLYILMRIEAPKKYCTCCKANRSLLDFKWNNYHQRYNTTCLMCAKRKKLKSIMVEEQKKMNTFNEFIELLSK